MRQLKLLLCSLLFIAISSSISAQEKSYELEEITVVARRKLPDIGVVKTSLDSTVLRESIANSLADVIAQNTSIYIKSYGRGSLATASFRGTAPSHTQVTWNGMKINSPMLGMVDFSLIPSFFIDNANIYHGSGSVGIAGGGFGGAITLDTKPVDDTSPLGLSFVQGISSYNTFDEFLKLHVNISDRLQSVTRAYYTSSDNDFKYTNYDNGRDENGNWIISRNKNGDYKDLHLMQELYYEGTGNNKFNFAGWFFDSKRGLPMLTVSEASSRSRNEQDEQTLRLTAGWNTYAEKTRMSATAGYTHSGMDYFYWADINIENLIKMIDTNSKVNTGYGQFNFDWFATPKLMLSTKTNLNMHSVESMDKLKSSGYDQSRFESSHLLSAKYNVTKRLGLASDFRFETYGNNTTPVIPSLFVDYLLIPDCDVLLKSSVSKNYRYPTLNDLYFIPGGNDSLKAEKGFTYDVGTEFGIKKERFSVTGELSYFNSQIDDWILWTPNVRGYWSPKNVKRVHSYGYEAKGKLFVDLGKKWKLYIDASWGETNSINKGEKINRYDESVGKQLVYVPKYSATLTGKIAWNGFLLTHKFSYYSERFTSSDNDASDLSRIPPYYMNDISLERAFPNRWGDLSLRATVNNLFDEEYVSVLSRPMAGRNFGLFIGITPKW